MCGFIDLNKPSLDIKKVKSLLVIEYFNTNKSALENLFAFEPVASCLFVYLFVWLSFSFESLTPLSVCLTTLSEKPSTLISFHRHLHNTYYNTWYVTGLLYEDFLYSQIQQFTVYLVLGH